MYIENLNHCIAEKTNKIRNHILRYPEWWLILVDFLAGGIRESEKSVVIQNLKNYPEWKQIVIIHPETKKEILKIGSSELVSE